MTYRFPTASFALASLLLSSCGSTDGPVLGSPAGATSQRGAGAGGANAGSPSNGGASGAGAGKGGGSAGGNAEGGESAGASGESAGSGGSAGTSSDIAGAAGASGAASTQGDSCDPLATTKTPVSFDPAHVLGAGVDADGTVYVIEQDGGGPQLFLGQMGTTLEGVYLTGSAQSGSATDVSFDDPTGQTKTVQVDQGANGKEMGVAPMGPGKTFPIGQTGDVLTLLGDAAISALSAEITHTHSIFYAGHVEDGRELVVTQIASGPVDQSPTMGQRVFFGPLDAIAEQTIELITGALSTGETEIVFDYQSAMAIAQLAGSMPYLSTGVGAPSQPPPIPLLTDGGVVPAGAVFLCASTTPCPADPPTPNASCDVQAQCAYGSDPRPFCREFFACDGPGTSWAVGEPGSTCPAPGEMGCPATMPSPGSSCDAPMAQITGGCAYPSVDNWFCVCGCQSEVCDGMPTIWQCGGSDPSPGCPAISPNVGSACTLPDGTTCNYGAGNGCAVGSARMVCKMGIWSSTGCLGNSSLAARPSDASGGPAVARGSPCCEAARGRQPSQLSRRDRALRGSAESAFPLSPRASSPALVARSGRCIRAAGPA